LHRSGRVRIRANGHVKVTVHTFYSVRHLSCCMREMRKWGVALLKSEPIRLRNGLFTLSEGTAELVIVGPRVTFR
jgi:hypothetical protein